MAKGKKTGGRQAGTKNKSSAAIRRSVAAQLAKGQGLTPFQYYTAKLNARKPRRRKADTDEDWAARIALWEDERDHAAHELLPYTAARLSAVTGDDGASAEQIEAVNKRTNKALEELG